MRLVSLQRHHLSVAISVACGMVGVRVEEGVPVLPTSAAFGHLKLRTIPLVPSYQYPRNHKSTLTWTRITFSRCVRASFRRTGACPLIVTIDRYRTSSQLVILIISQLVTGKPDLNRLFVMQPPCCFGYLSVFLPENRDTLAHDVPFTKNL